jgi:glycosyltransferase 2 family protein
MVAAARSGRGRGLTTRYRVSTSVFALIVSGVALWWLLSGSVQAAFAQAMHRAQLWPLAAAWAVVPVIQGLRAWRFSLLATGRPAAPSWPMYVIASRLLLFNYLLPFKLGEVSFPLSMRRAFGTDYVRSIGVLIVARLMDLCVVSAMVVFGVVLVIDPVNRDWHLPALVGAGVAVLALPLLGIELLDPVWRVSGWLPRRAPSPQLWLWRAGLCHPLPQRALALALTLSIWIMQATLACLAASTVADGLGFVEVMLANAAANLAFAMPVSGLAGLGPPQAAWATTLHLTGVAWPLAIVTALICHGVQLTGALGLGVATFLLPAWQTDARTPPPGLPGIDGGVLANIETAPGRREAADQPDQLYRRHRIHEVHAYGALELVDAGGQAAGGRDERA